jgi:acyl-CoA synthetase (NDP forming)
MGNRSDVSGNDLLQYWEADPHTDVVCMYIESLGNPRRFSRLARRLTRTKPVVAVKAGRRGAAAAVLRQTGVIGVPSLPAMLDTTLLLVHQPLPQGRRVAVLGNAGGSLAIAVDAVHDAELSVASLAAHEREALADLSGRAQGAEAVVDLGLRASGSDVQRAVELLAAASEVDAVLMVYAPSLGGTADEVRAALEAASQAASSVPVVACFYGPHAVGGSVPLYGAVDAAAMALGRVSRYAEWLAEPEGNLPELDDAVVADITERARGLLADGPVVLQHLDGVDLLAPAGLDLLAGRVVGSMDDAVAAAEDLGYPIVLKAAGRDRAAKTSAEGFAIDLEDDDAVRNAWGRMEASLGPGLAPVLVQPMVGPGLDVAVRVTADDVVGPVLSISPGGAAAAREDVTDVRVLPLTDLDASRFVAGSRLDALLSMEARASFEALLLQVGALVEGLPELTGLELNPVILREGRAIVTQATVELTAVEVDPLPPLRRV